MNLYPLINRTLNAVGCPGGTITGVSTANPGVVTTSAAHNLQDGDQIQVTGVVGATQADTTCYAKITGYSATTFGLFQDAALTIGINVTGSYSSGGLVSVAFDVSGLAAYFGLRLRVEGLSTTGVGTPAVLIALQDSADGFVSDIKTIAVLSLSGPISSRTPLTQTWLPDQLNAFRAGIANSRLRLYVEELTASSSVTCTLSIEA